MLSRHVTRYSRRFWLVASVCVLLLSLLATHVLSAHPTRYPAYWWRQVVYNQYYCPLNRTTPAVSSAGAVTGSMSKQMLQSIPASLSGEITLSSSGGKVLLIDQLPLRAKQIRVTAPKV
mgnify:CR=1 FL=1